MKSHPYFSALAPLRWAAIGLVVLCLVVGAACGKKRSKKSKSSASDGPSENTNTASERSGGSSTGPSSALGMLPKERTLWLELRDPQTVIRKWGLLGANGAGQLLLGTDKDSLEKVLGVDIATEAGWRKMGFALNRPMGLAVSMATYADATTRKSPVVVLYAHLHSSSALRKLIDRLSPKDSKRGPKLQALGGGQYVLGDNDTCLAINNDVAMLIIDTGYHRHLHDKKVGEAIKTAKADPSDKPFDKTGSTDSTEPSEPPTEKSTVDDHDIRLCREALNRYPSNSLASVKEVEDILDGDDDIRGYHTGDALLSVLTAAIRHLTRGRGDAAYNRARTIANATVSAKDRVKYTGSIGDNSLSGTMAIESTGKTLIPNAFKNADPPDWRGYLPREPTIIAELNLDMYAFLAWWATVSQTLKLHPDEAMAIVRNSGLTGQLGLYLSLDSEKPRRSGPEGIQLHIFAGLNDVTAIQTLLSSIEKPTANIDGPIWSFRGLGRQNTWVGFRRNTAILTTDLDLLKRAGDSPPRTAWSLETDSDAHSGLLRFSISTVASWFFLYSGSMDHYPEAAEAVALGDKRDPAIEQQLAKLRKDRRAVEKEQSNLREQRRKDELKAGEAIIQTLGTVQISGARTDEGVQVDAAWTVEDRSWSQWMKRSMKIASDMKEKSGARFEELETLWEKEEAIQKEIRKLRGW